MLYPGLYEQVINNALNLRFFISAPLLRGKNAW